MKLLNNTPVPDAVLEAVLLKAGRAVGAKTSNVVVQVNRAMWRSPIRGVASECCSVRWKGCKRWTSTDGGAFKISLPLLSLKSEKNPNVLEHKRKHYDALSVAGWFFKVARHEWGHIRDYQNGGRWRLAFSRKGINGKRPKHDSRPEEIRADNYGYDADERGRGENWACDEVVALGVALESYRDGGAA